MVKDVSELVRQRTKHKTVGVREVQQVHVRSKEAQ